jgi:hypothetical protein
MAWEELRHLRVTVPLHAPMEERELELAVRTRGEGVEEGFENAVRDMCCHASVPLLRRVLQVLAGYASSVELAAVGRDGGGTDSMPRFQDIDVFDFLWRLSTLAPCALRFEKSSRKLKSPNPPVLWHIRDAIIKPALGRRLLLSPSSDAIAELKDTSTNITSSSSISSKPNTTSSTKNSTNDAGWEVTTDTELRILRPDQRAGVDYMMARFLRLHTSFSF